LVIGIGEGLLRLDPCPAQSATLWLSLSASIRIAVQKLFIRDDEGLDRDSFDAGSNILGGVSAAAGWPTTNVSSTKTAVGKRFIPFDIGAGFMVPPN
jgi:hypothetical protein